MPKVVNNIYIILIILLLIHFAPNYALADGWIVTGTPYIARSYGDGTGAPPYTGGTEHFHQGEDIGFVPDDEASVDDLNVKSPTFGIIYCLNRESKWVECFIDTIGGKYDYYIIHIDTGIASEYLYELNLIDVGTIFGKMLWSKCPCAVICGYENNSWIPSHIHIQIVNSDVYDFMNEWRNGLGSTIIAEELRNKIISLKLNKYNFIPAIIAMGASHNVRINIMEYQNPFSDKNEYIRNEYLNHHIIYNYIDVISQGEDATFNINDNTLILDNNVIRNGESIHVINNASVAGIAAIKYSILQDNTSNKVYTKLRDFYLMDWRNKINYIDGEENAKIPDQYIKAKKMMRTLYTYGENPIQNIPLEECGNYRIFYDERRSNARYHFYSVTNTDNIFLNGIIVPDISDTNIKDKTRGITIDGTKDYLQAWNTKANIRLMNLCGGNSGISCNGMEAELARINQEAYFNYGYYTVEVTGYSYDDLSGTGNDTVIVDNFRPYVEFVDVYPVNSEKSGYYKYWSSEETDEGLQLTECFNELVNGQCINTTFVEGKLNVKVGFSEAMSEARVDVLPYKCKYMPSCTHDHYPLNIMSEKSKLPGFNGEYRGATIDVSKIDDKKVILKISGKDLAGNELLILQEENTVINPATQLTRHEITNINMEKEWVMQGGGGNDTHHIITIAIHVLKIKSIFEFLNNIIGYGNIQLAVEGLADYSDVDGNPIDIKVLFEKAKYQNNGSIVTVLDAPDNPVSDPSVDGEYKFPNGLNTNEHKDDPERTALINRDAKYKDGELRLAAEIQLEDSGELIGYTGVKAYIEESSAVAAAASPAQGMASMAASAPNAQGATPEATNSGDTILNSK